MILRGDNFNEHFIGKVSEGRILAEGLFSAFFGYKVVDGNIDNEGVWVTWNWDGKTFELKNDRFGFYPMYFYTQDGQFGISSDLSALANTLPRVNLDDAAISVFLRLGYYIGDTTPFQDIRRVPPACTMKWNKEGLSIQTKSSTLSATPINITRYDAIRTYGEIFQQVIKRFSPDVNDNPSLLLSGGRDSRHILFAIKRTRILNPDCVTVRLKPPFSKDDTIFSKQITRTLRLNHTTFPQSLNEFKDEKQKNTITGFCSSHHAWLMKLSRYFDTKGITLVYDGIGGDALSSTYSLNRTRLDLFDAGKWDELAEDYLRSESWLPYLLTADFYKRFNRERAAALLASELKKHGKENNPAGQFSFMNDVRRDIALGPWRILSNTTRIAVSPYLSGTVFDYLSSLPASFFLDHSFHSETIQTTYPEYAFIPFERKEHAGRKKNYPDLSSLYLTTALYCYPRNHNAHMINYHEVLVPLMVQGIRNRAEGTKLLKMMNTSIYLCQLFKSFNIE